MRELGDGGGGALGGDLLEQLAQLLEALLAEALGPALLDLGEEAEADSLGLAATLGQADQLGAAVGGVGDALDVAEADQVVDQLAERTAW